MEKKYYTPEIEDLFVGYECEVYKVTINSYIHKASESWWEPVIITLDNLWDVCNELERRTPFLSKEDIDKENLPENIACLIYTDVHKIQIVNSNKVDKIVYDGRCPSINEFRKIIKLLDV